MKFQLQDTFAIKVITSTDGKQWLAYDDETRDFLATVLADYESFGEYSLIIPGYSLYCNGSDTITMMDNDEENRIRMFNDTDLWCEEGGMRFELAGINGEEQTIIMNVYRPDDDLPEKLQVYVSEKLVRKNSYSIPDWVTFIVTEFDPSSNEG